MIFSSNTYTKVEKFLDEKGAQSLGHIKQGSLYDHLVRVKKILLLWGLDEDTALAGMLHSVYSTEFFKKSLISSSDRLEIKKLIGEYAESIVYSYHDLDRSSLHVEQEGISYISRNEGERVTINKTTAKSLIHILLVNDLDHVDENNHNYVNTKFSQYLLFRDFLCEDALKSLLKIAKARPEDDKEYIRFIAHAGIEIKTYDKKILIDPWIYSSTFESPIIQSLDPNHKSIDFIIPEPQVNIDDIVCDIVCISHFHTHHSPLREIQELARKRDITVICPKLSNAKLSEIKASIGEYSFNKIHFIFLDYYQNEDDGSVSKKNVQVEKILSSPVDFLFNTITIKCIPSPQEYHFAYHIENKNFSVLHITDASYNRSRVDAMDSFWLDIACLKTDYLFLGAASGGRRSVNNNLNREIIENLGLNPIQAAKVVEKIMPTHVGLIGIDNFSIWCNRVEYRLATPEIHVQFEWAISYLAPSINVIRLRPGFIIRNI